MAYSYEGDGLDVVVFGHCIVVVGICFWGWM